MNSITEWKFHKHKEISHVSNEIPHRNPTSGQHEWDLSKFSEFSWNFEISTDVGEIYWIVWNLHRCQWDFFKYFEILTNTCEISWKFEISADVGELSWNI